jgi:flagellar biogenesis protein FliO
METVIPLKLLQNFLSVFCVLCFFFTLCFGFVRERRKKEKKMEAKRNGREMGGRGVYI